MPRRKMPLEYMLSVMNDKTVPEERRDRMAMAAAPYCHPRLIPAKHGNKPGKKQKQLDAAVMARTGTPWSRDLTIEDRPN